MIALDLPRGWAMTSVGEVAIYQNGRAFKPSEWSTKGLPIIRIQNLNGTSPSYNFSEKYHEEKFRVRKGDLLFAWSASLGAFIWRGQDAWLNQHIFRVDHTKVIDRLFLYYALKTITLDLYSKAHGSGMVHVTKGKFEETPLRLPPLAEQHRIVSKIEELFSELDRGAENLEKAREQLKLYRQAVLKHAFEGKLTAKWREENKDKLETSEQPKKEQTISCIDSEFPATPQGWQFVKLHEITEINPRLDKSAYADSLTVSFVPMLAVDAGTGIIDASHIRPFREVKKGYTHFQENDVIFAKITPCMENGKIAVVPPLENKLGFGSTEFHVLRAGNEASAQYIFYFVSSEQFSKNAEHNMTGAVGQRRVPAAWLANERVPLPSLPEQRIIVARIKESLSQVTKLLKMTNVQLVRISSLRQSILKRAFSGKLVSQDPNDEPASVLLERIKVEKAARPHTAIKPKRRRRTVART